MAEDATIEELARIMFLDDARAVRAEIRWEDLPPQRQQGYYRRAALAIKFLSGKDNLWPGA